MTSDHRVTTTTAAVLLGLSLGCGGEFPMADVSGVITLDGQPLENATVFFQPRRSSSNPIVGPPAIGVTDDAGRYEVTTHKLGSGAVVGQHVVSISTFETRMKDPKNSDALEVVSEERVPKRYRAPSELSFEVPSGGSREANFELTSN